MPKCTKIASSRCTKYSTIGRKNINIESKTIDSGEMFPKYGKALSIYNAKQGLQKLFN